MASLGYGSHIYPDLGMPDPRAVPQAYEGVLLRRVLAYFVDLCVIGVLAVSFLIPSPRCGSSALACWVRSCGFSSD